MAADAQRPVERLVDQTRDLGFIREVEPGIDVGFEWEFADERQAEGVNGRDRDVAEPLAQVAPAGRIELRGAARVAQARDDALPHFGRGLPRERDRENVVGGDAREQQIHVALDQHAGLPRAGRRLEDDVLRGIGRVTPRVRVREWPTVVKRQARVRRHRRNPSGTRP